MVEITELENLFALRICRSMSKPSDVLLLSEDGTQGPGVEGSLFLVGPTDRIVVFRREKPHSLRPEGSYEDYSGLVLPDPF